MQKILVIQTAFIGDVVLSTALLETLYKQYPTAAIDILVRKGNESLFNEHPFLHKVIVWDKQKRKYKNWLKILIQIRHSKYDAIVNVQRYAATGIWTAFSNATKKIGFDKNPFSFLFTHSIKRVETVKGLHEIHKNHALLSVLNVFELSKPKLYPSKLDYEKVLPLQSVPYLCIAPASVWFTKQFPVEKWIQLINEIPFEGFIYLIGGPGDKPLGEKIMQGIQVSNQSKKQIVNVIGQLSFLASAALQQKAVLNYVNDSAPMHFASAVNAPVVAIYCSTIPDFGYGPLSEQAFIVQTAQVLKCRPCGVHGKKACPLGHFNCAATIEMKQLFTPLLQMA